MIFFQGGVCQPYTGASILGGWGRRDPPDFGQGCRGGSQGGLRGRGRVVKYYYIVLYCIVLYLYIYIALLAVHTNQKRFQCERPREKRAVLRERKEALGSLVNKVDR